MKTLLLRTAAVALMGTAAWLPLSAQQVPHDDHEDAAITLNGGVCGNSVWDMSIEDAQRAVAQTRQNNPALYRQMQADAKSPSRARLADVGDQYPFYVRNRVSGEYEQVPATEKAEGRYSKVWVEDAIAGQVSATKIAQLIHALDSATVNGSRNVGKGIIQNDIDVYGQPPHPGNDDGYIHFLITDIKDGFTGGAFVAGYFYPYDQSDGPGSNQLNILYIDVQNFASSAGVNDVLNTMAHEFQHNIHFNTCPGSNTFFNEGCSEEASILNGYPNRGNGGYRGNTNIDLLSWTRDNDPTGSKTLADYERAMTFTHYMREQFGEGFLTVFNATRVDGIDRIDQALQTYGRNERWQDVLKGFAVANQIVKYYPDSRYVYDKPIYQTYVFSSSQKKYSIKPPTAAAGTSSGSVQLAPYGISYLSYTTASGGLRPTFTWSGQAAVMAIAYRDTVPVRVVELTNGQATDLVESAAYTKIVFALVNLRAGGTNSTIDWTVETLSSGVDVATDAHTLSIAAITPNPAHESAMLNLTAARGGDVKVEVYDGAGAMVMEQMVNAQAGHATVTIPTAGLASGAYVVRLRQGEASATRSLVVAH